MSNRYDTRVHYSIKTSSTCQAKVTYEPEKNRTVFNYPCSDTVNCSPYTVYLRKGVYKFECWGASGGFARHNSLETLNTLSGGNGSYVSGYIRLIKKTKFYIYIGGRGEDQSSIERYAYGKGGYNGGGDGGADLNDGDYPESGAGGGGGTDIRIIYSDDPQNIESLKSRIMVASGGGGGSSGSDDQCGYTYDTNDDLLCTNRTIFITLESIAGSGGILHGYRTTHVTYPGNQTSGSFGKGMTGTSLNSNAELQIWGGSIAGGGGGYFGGTCTPEEYLINDRWYQSAGAGGSSYVSGLNGCRSVKQYPTESVETADNPIHYSGYSFEWIKAIDGIHEFLSPSGVVERGHAGSGCAAITVIDVEPLPTLKLQQNQKGKESHYLYV